MDAVKSKGGEEIGKIELDKGWMRKIACFFFARPFCSIHVLANYYHSLARSQRVILHANLYYHSLCTHPYCFFLPLYTLDDEQSQFVLFYLRSI